MMKDDKIKSGFNTENLKLRKSESNNFESAEGEEINLFKKLLFKIWGVAEILQDDVGFLKKLYTTPKRPKKQDMNKEDRKALLKHKPLTRKRKLD